MMGPWMRLALAVFATWRVTHLLASEDGPADLIFKLRSLLGESIAGKLMDCFYCLSLWIAALAALFVTRSPMEWFITCLAVSGAACLLERMGKQQETTQPAAQHAEGGMDNVLRSEAFAVSKQSGPGEGTEHFSISPERFPV